ncbi:PDZ domain-containing protein, partial [Candidatus Aerophobetes bacterium]
KENFVKDELLGIEVRDITPELEEEYEWLEGEEGVVITSIESEGPIDKVEMSAGDVIRKINGKSIKDLNDFKKAMEKVEPGDEVLVEAHCRKWGRIWSVSTPIYTQK